MALLDCCSSTIHPASSRFPPRPPHCFSLLLFLIVSLFPSPLRHFPSSLIVSFLRSGSARLSSAHPLAASSHFPPLRPARWFSLLLLLLLLIASPSFSSVISPPPPPSLCRSPTPPPPQHCIPPRCVVRIYHSGYTPASWSPLRRR